MTFNSKGKLASFYKFFLKEGDSLPEDFCTYFWGLYGLVSVGDQQFRGATLSEAMEKVREFAGKEQK